MTQPSTEAPKLGARLRALRLQHGATQRQVAKALGVGVSSVSSYESGSVPPTERLADYATLFSTDRADVGPLPDDEELTSGELASKTALLGELVDLASGESEGSESAAVKDLWSFPPGEPIMLAVGSLDEMTHPYSDARSPNYTGALNLADLDALIELFGHVRMRNPESDVRFIPAGRLTAADNLARHLVILGGPGLNARLQQIFGRTPLPIRQREHPKVKDGEVFYIRNQAEPVLPEWDEDDPDLLTEDVGLFARLTNPLNVKRTLTWCSGVFARGVLGSVRMLTDAELREQNTDYLSGRFASATQFAILAKVPVLLGETITPDLQNEDARLFEWSDAEPRQPGRARPDGDATPKATAS